MSDTFREVTTRSWFSRVGGSIGGMLFGLILLLVGIVLLFWNEGRAVQTAKSLAEGAGVVVSVDAAAVDPANEGRLVHTTGTVATSETLADPTFGISAKGIRLSRDVEMYQWKESSESETKKKLGGGEETVTTYTYSRDWSSEPINSGAFKQPGGHQNPAMSIRSRDFRLASARMGAFNLDAGVLDQVDDAEALPLGSEAADKARASLGTARPVGIVDGRIHVGDAASPVVGDYRIGYQLVPLGEISVIGRQSGGGFAPYQTKAGDRLLMVDSGNVPAEGMFAEAVTGNTILTWILRAVGLLLIAIAFGLLLAPLGVVADVIPMLGSLVRLGTGLAAFVAAILVGAVVIAIAWFWYRPVLSLIVLAVGIGIAFLLAWFGRKRAVPAATPAAAARS